MWYICLVWRAAIYYRSILKSLNWPLYLESRIASYFHYMKVCTTIYLSRFSELSVLANALHGKTTQSCPRWGIELQAILLHGQLVLHGIKHMNIHNTWHGLSHYWMIKSYMHMKDDTICFSLWWLRRKSWLTVPSLV